ncbi:hypothetical protein BDP27DRAFT_1310406 [Rhodocollybia butyracea]|uniref:Uncharacterized protein n=1 Tax=Rhodocollybia butyracea TaxID=206335 RepID=A0A9P5UG32_9AGAR|nr:hypothetical protein BDP27DRAFT_1310406 [Rhodocollybia butyracea]
MFCIRICAHKERPQEPSTFSFVSQRSVVIFAIGFTLLIPLNVEDPLVLMTIAAQKPPRSALRKRWAIQLLCGDVKRSSGALYHSGSVSAHHLDQSPGDSPPSRLDLFLFYPKVIELVGGVFYGNVLHMIPLSIIMNYYDTVPL